MAKRKRDVPVLFWVSAEELELIHQELNLTKIFTIALARCAIFPRNCSTS